MNIPGGLVGAVVGGVMVSFLTDPEAGRVHSPSTSVLHLDLWGLS